MWLSVLENPKSREEGNQEPPSTFRCVQLHQVLKFCGVASDRAALVTLHVAVGTAIAEYKTGGGEGRVVDPNLAAQRADSLELGQELGVCPLVKVHRWWRGRQCCQSLDGLLVFRRVPPFQKLEEEDSHGQPSGEGDGQATQDFLCCQLHSLRYAG